MKPTPDRRQSDMTTQEQAFRQGMRRRTTDRHDQRAYYGMLALMLSLFVTIGILSWLAY